MVHQDSEGTSKGGLVLGIESSCDDTGVAVVRACDGAILGQAIANQVDIHAPWGGVVPKLAQEAHEAAMDSTVESALQQAGVHAADLEAVAVTVGPGLSLCLKVGVQKARQLAAAHGLKYVAVHHMEAHALVVRASAPVTFPFLCLLVSGGHNLLVIVHGVGRYSLLGSTLDDAVGEAYDKVARLLGLELRPSGGAAVEALAQEGDEQRYKFSMPLRQRPNCNFSYAGLKTAVRLAIEAEAPGPATDDNRQVRADIAASFQRVALAHLEERTRRAAAWALDSEPAIRHLVVAGGVAANKLLRSKLQGVAGEMGLELVVPAPQLCTDNGVMVAWAGVERLALGLWEHLPASSQDDAWVDVRPRWPLTDQRDSRSLSEPRSERKKGIYTSLTALTEAALCVANGRQ
ncbi:tRNA N6-adenosine threonylcarbamoyltransferase [Coccomyxa sp. Obi]|nr:tRNA N6-adenosine threonylcarbamoyltransferase [Coccomyxa sp. Obi]